MDFDIIDLKLIDAWFTLCSFEDDSIKTIVEIVEEVRVPEKYIQEVSIKIAERRIQNLPQKEV